MSRFVRVLKHLMYWALSRKLCVCSTKAGLIVFLRKKNMTGTSKFEPEHEVLSVCHRAPLRKLVACNEALWISLTGDIHVCTECNQICYSFIVIYKGHPNVDVEFRVP